MSNKKWTNSLEMKCWHTTVEDVETSKRYVIAHLGEADTERSIIRVRRELSADKSLDEHVALARAGLGRALRDMAEGVEKGAAAIGATVHTLEDLSPAEAESIACPLPEHECCQSEPCKYPDSVAAALAGKPWLDEPPEEFHDGEGYPTEKFLEWLARTKQHGPAMELAREYVDTYTCGSVTEFTDDEALMGPKKRVAISTGGWSGCEDVIEALESNRWWWLCHWYSSRVGGHYVFELECRYKPAA